MTIRKHIEYCEKVLDDGGIEAYAFEAKEIVAFALGTRANRLWAIIDTDAPEGIDQKIMDCLAKRTHGEPLQYILGEWEFYSLPFKVGTGVLIPRADTEIIVDKALEELKGKRDARVADLCSGSGCIAISIAKNCPDCNVDAYELSEDAIKFLKANNELNGTNVNIIQGDILKADCAQKYDIILSNPPYIRTAEIDTLEEEVSHEPTMALDGGSDGLDFYRCITEKWINNLNEGGKLMVEIGYDQADEVKHLFQAAGLTDIQAVKDLGGNHRVIIGTLPYKTT